MVPRLHDEPRIMCTYNDSSELECEPAFFTTPVCKCGISQNIRFGETLYQHSVNLSNQDNVTCHWSHNETSNLSGSSFIEKGKSNEVLVFKNPVSYFYLGWYVLNCTNSFTGHNNAVVLVMHYEDIKPREFPATDLPYIDQDSHTLNPNPVPVIPEANGAFAPTVIGPVRAKFVSVLATGTWCAESGANRSCCEMYLRLENTTTYCSGALEGWTAKFSRGRYTGYVLFTLEHVTRANRTKVQNVLFTLVQNRVIETRNFSLVRVLETSSPVPATERDCLPGGDLLIGASIGTFLLGVASTVLAVFIVVCIRRLCVPAVDQHVCHSLEASATSSSTAYRTLKDGQGAVNINSEALLRRPDNCVNNNPIGDNRASCGDDDFYLSFDKHLNV